MNNRGPQVVFGSDEGKIGEGGERCTTASTTNVSKYEQYVRPETLVQSGPKELCVRIPESDSETLGHKLLLREIKNKTKNIFLISSP